MQERKIKFLKESLTHHRDVRNALDNKAALLLGLSGVVLAISISNMKELQYLVMAICSLISALILVFVVSMPFKRKTRIKMGLICWWGNHIDSFSEYKQEVERATKTENSIAEEYMKEIWNLANYSLKQKTKLIRWSSWILILGLLGGLILFIL